MSIKRTIITTIVSLALVAMVAPGVAQGVTIAELQAQIQQLLAQLQTLQGGTTTPSGNVPAVCAGVTFTRNLTTGSTGSDVKCLQAILNMSAGTQVAITGAGSPGSETSYFGGLTLVAVKKYQTANGILPANQVGPLTRAKLNAVLAGGTTTPVNGCPAGAVYNTITGALCTGNPVITPTGSGLTVQLAYDNPASGTLVDGQALASMVKVTFVNGDNADVKVTGLKLKRIGISADASIVNTYLFDGATRLTDGAAVSSTVVSFNNSLGLFTVPAGGSKTISVLADVNGTSGETMGMQVVASTDVTTNASSVKGNFPLSGNLMSLATGTLAGVEFNATTTPSDATIDPQTDYTVWQNSLVVTTRAVDMTRISFRKTGSVKDADLTNFRLYVDGVQVGSTVPNIVLNANSESLVTFDLTAAPKRLEAGTRVVKLLADIIGGSGLTFQFHLWNSADVTVVDTQYGANILSDLLSDAAFTKRSAGTSGQTVGSGTISFTKMTSSPSGKVVNLASNASLAKFEVKAAGEKVKIETLYISANVNTAGVSGLRNGMLLANGVQIGSTTTLYDTVDSSYDYTTFNLGSSLIVEPGSPVTLEVRADIYDTGTGDTTNSIIADSTTIQVVIEGSASWNNATGLTSSTTIDAPSSDVSGNTLTVSSGGLTVSKYTAYTDQAMAVPLTAAKLGYFTITANTTEAVNINTIEANLNNVVSTYASNLYVKIGGEGQAINTTTSIKAAISTVSNSWSVNYVLPAGQTVDLQVFADINAYASGIGYVGAFVSGTTASSATAVSDGTTATISDVQGQNITFTAGVFTPAVDGTTPLALITAGGQEVIAGKFKFTAQYEAHTINEMRFTVNANANAANNSSAIISAILKDGDTVLATVPYNSSANYFNITGLNVAVPADTVKVLSLVFSLSPYISSSSSNSQVDVTPTLDYVKYSNSQGTQTAIGTGETVTTTYATSKEVYVFRSVPTITKVPVTTSYLYSGAKTVDLYSWKVKADAKGPVAVKQIKLGLTWADGDTSSTLQLYAFKLYKNGSPITTLVTITDEDGHDLTTATAVDGANESSSTVIIHWATEDTIAAGTESTYVLEATASGFVARAQIAGDDAVSVSMPADTTVNGATIKYVVKSSADNIMQLATSAGGSAEDANFIWSDSSASLHSYTSATAGSTATSSGDWANGRLVLNLPLSTTTWTGQ